MQMLKEEKLDKIKLLIQATKLFCDSGVCPKTQRTFHYWWDFVKFCHKKGYLYLGMSNNKVDLAAVGFRANKVTKNTGKIIPKEESGDILYVPVLSSVSSDKMKIFKMLKYYMSKNNVSKIAYRWRGKQDDLRVRNLSHV